MIWIDEGRRRAVETAQAVADEWGPLALIEVVDDYEGRGRCAIFGRSGTTQPLYWMHDWAWEFEGRPTEISVTVSAP